MIFLNLSTKRLCRTLFSLWSRDDKNKKFVGAFLLHNPFFEGKEYLMKMKR